MKALIIILIMFGLTGCKESPSGKLFRAKSMAACEDHYGIQRIRYMKPAAVFCNDATEFSFAQVRAIRGDRVAYYLKNSQ